jgi:hypothetical protein
MKSTKMKYILLLLLAISAAGCKKYLDVNATPNKPTSVPPNLLLPTALSGTAFATTNELNRFTAVTTDYLTGAGGSPQTWDIYVTDGSDFGNQWGFELYGSASLISYKKMMEGARALDGLVYIGVGKIMSAYTFSIATDVWGDVPYSDALYGDDKQILQPKLDTQEDIYKGNGAITGLLDMVKEGVMALDSPSTMALDIDDIIYNGDVDAWKKAGNTLRLKLAMQICQKEPALATSVINELLATDDFITDNAENLAVPFGSSVGSRNPLYELINISLFRNEMIVSTRYVDRLKALDDPRLPLFVTKPTGDYVTLDNGYRGSLPASTTWSKWSDVITGKGGVGPAKLLTSAQRAFMLAEAGIRLDGVNISDAEAQAYFEEGIRASMADAGVPGPAIDDYFTTHPAVVTLSGSNAHKIEQIITQKYIAQTGCGLETWNDWRRTGYPVLPEHQNAVGIDGHRPVRAQYVNDEVTSNPNFKNVILPNVKVWWDVD